MPRRDLSGRSVHIRSGLTNPHATFAEVLLAAFDLRLELVGHFQFVLQNASFDALVTELPAFVKRMRELPGLTSVNEDLRLDRPELWIHVDREKAAELGVPIREVARTLQVLTSGLDLSTFKRGVRQYKVMASLAPNQRATPRAMSE